MNLNRRTFLHALSALAPAALLGRSFAAAKSESNRPAFKIPQGQDRDDAPISLYEGDTFFTKVSGRDTHGDLYIYESTRLRQGGPAQHFHYEQDEWIYILEGDFVIKVGETTYQARPGDSVFAPQRIPHVWAKTSQGPARMLIAFQPAGKMEDYFKAVSQGRVARMPPAEQEEFRRQHGFQRTGPALFHQKQ